MTKTEEDFLVCNPMQRRSGPAKANPDRRYIRLANL
jgi:hypothetical protein